LCILHCPVINSHTPAMLLGQNLGHPGSKEYPPFPYKNNFPQSRSVYGFGDDTFSWDHDAQQRQAKLRAQSHLFPVESVTSPHPSSMPMPFQKKKDSYAGSQEHAMQPPLAEQPRHIVEVQGLPQHLMSPPMMRAILDQAGLEKDVRGFDFTGPGMALIEVASNDAAEKCAEHFHGCKWNQGGSIFAQVVNNRAAALTTTQKPCRTRQPQRQMNYQATNEAATSGYRLPWLPDQAPAYIHVAEKENFPRRRRGTSDTSTNVGSDEDCRSW